MLREGHDQLPALVFIAPGPNGMEVHCRVDLRAPDSKRERALLKAMLSTAYGLMDTSEPEVP
jgi:hypothetical protein